jgi:glycosyltransferase involved in cell wall biosynthesis
MDSDLLVSTIIPAFNAERFIARALQSALAQNIGAAEIIVVDDASTDHTRDVVARYAEHGVRLICHPRQSGAAAARNTGIGAATGKFIAFLDADDEWLPGKLERQLAVITAHPDMSLISCRATLIDERGNENGDIYRGAPPAMGREAWRTLLTYPCVATPSVVVRRAALLAAGAFNRWLPVGEDQDMWIRLSLRGEVGHVPESLVRVHSTPNSLSKINFTAQAGYVLPMITAYTARNRHRLTTAEKNKILGERYSKMGQSAYANGEFRFGLVTLLSAILFGNRPLQNLLFVVRAAATTRRFKRFILGVPSLSAVRRPI